MKETRILVQEKDETGEFKTIASNNTMVGIMFKNKQPVSIITGSLEEMMYASGMISGFAIGRENGSGKMAMHSLNGEDDNHA